MRTLFILLSSCALLFGQAFTFQDPAFVGATSGPYVPPPFNPDSVSGMVHRYKPGTTVWKTGGGAAAGDGDDIFSWRDSKGSGHTVVGGAGSAPKYRTTAGPSSGPCVDCNIGGFQFLYANVSSHVQPITIFCLIKIVNQSSDSGLWSSTVPGNVGVTLSASTTGALDAGVSLSLPAITDTGWIIVSACMNGSASWIRTNGVQYATGDSGTGTMEQVVLGNNGTLDRPLLGKMVELMMYSGSTIATNNIANIEGYFTTTYGL